MKGKATKTRALTTALAVALMSVGVLCLSGCPNKPGLSSDGGGEEAASALGSSAPPPSSDGEGEKLVINCSVGALPLAVELSDAFRQARDVEIDITANGKSAAAAALESGDCDICIFEEDPEVVPDWARGKALAYKAVAVIVNPSSGINELDSAQIYSIFTGESADWADYGGSGGISLILPESDDCFRLCFEDVFSLKGSVNGIKKSLAPREAVISNDTERIVSETPGAIGICPAASLSDMNAAVRVDGVAPTAEAVKDGTYKACQSLIIAAAKDASNAANGFYDYCFTAGASSAIKKAGFYPVKE